MPMCLFTSQLIKIIRFVTEAMCVNNLTKVALDSAAAGIESEIFFHSEVQRPDQYAAERQKDAQSYPVIDVVIDNILLSHFFAQLQQPAKRHRPTLPQTPQQPSLNRASTPHQLRRTTTSTIKARRWSMTRLRPLMTVRG